MKKEQALENAIFAMGARSGRNFSDVFGDFLEISLGLLCNNPSDHQRKLISDTFSNDERKNLFLSAMQAYGVAAEGYHDPLGDMFMNNISHGNNGQFFTPDELSLMMSQIVGVRDGDTLNDPSCGSGRTLLMALMNARVHGNEPILFGNDISYTCSQMCLMNFLFNSARGEVSCGDTLLMDLDSFRFYHIDRVMMPDGGWVSTYWQYTTNSVNDVNRLRNEWRMKMMANGLWVEMVHDHTHETKAIVTEEAEPVQEERREKRKDDQLTAKPKAAQLQLNLFE